MCALISACIDNILFAYNILSIYIQIYCYYYDFQNWRKLYAIISTPYGGYMRRRFQV